MASTYVNDLRLNEMATGDGSGTWGTTTNTNLELIAEAFSYGTEVITTNADTHTTTIADGATDPGRSMYLKYTGTLDSACTITIGPNTVSKVWIIENGTSGSQDIILSQGSGANITIPAGDTKVVYSDGAGAGAAFFDAFASINVGALTGTSLDISGDIDVDGTTNLDVVDIDGAVDMASTLAVAGVLTGASLDISGDIDVDGTTNLDVVDVDGAVNFAADVTFADGANIITASAGTSNFRAGVNAGNSITSGGNFNTVVGDEAGTAITTGDNNVALGYKALFTEDTGQRSVAIGDFALTVQNNDDSNYNTAVGYAAGTAVTTGVQNTFIGGLAGNAITTAPSNTAVGYSALLSNSTGGGNTAVGYEALRNSTAASNTAVGTYSLYTNTSGTYNTAIGVDIPGTALGALGNNTTGSNNTAVGTAALAATTTGDKNVALGDSAGYSNTTGTGNVFLGNGAGYNTTGSGNTFVGGSTSGLYYPAGYLVTSGANNTIIGGYNGNEGSLDIRTSSNNIVLSDGDGNPRVHITSSGSMRQLANAGVVGLALAQATTSDSDNAIRYHRNSDITHSGDVRFVVFSSGNVQNTNNSYAGISDEKLKDNITDATPKLEKLKQVKVRSYNFKDEPDFKQIGVVAQELETVFPNLVETIDDQDMGLTKSVKYSVFVPILIKAIQEQQTIIESLTARITTLEG
jgi:hypothetical protein